MLKSLYSNALIYVFPSDLEGMPISLLEAMSYSNCCLASDIPENAEVLLDNGVTFKKGDVRDLKEKLTSLIHDPDAVQGYRRRAGERAKAFSWDAVVNQTISVYEKAVRGEKTRHIGKGTSNEGI